MLRRSSSSVFVAGAHVFPGGAVDPSDRVPTDEPFPGEDAMGSAYRVAAIRECFEEAGILVAERQGSGLLSAPDSGLERRLREYRAALVHGRADFLEICRRESLEPGIGRLGYLSRWVTPEGLPRRYDTRFFVTPAPEGQVPAACERETFDAAWFQPADALAAARRGEIELVLPTIRTLEQLADCDDAASVVRAASGSRSP